MISIVGAGVSRDNKGRIGNGVGPISKEDAAEIRLADIVAASSCLPGGRKTSRRIKNIYAGATLGTDAPWTA